MSLILTYHQIQDENDGYEIVGYYSLFDSSFIEEEESELKSIIRSEPQ